MNTPTCFQQVKDLYVSSSLQIANNCTPSLAASFAAELTKLILQFGDLENPILSDAIALILSYGDAKDVHQLLASNQIQKLSQQCIINNHSKVPSLSIIQLLLDHPITSKWICSIEFCSFVCEHRDSEVFELILTSTSSLSSFTREYEAIDLLACETLDFLDETSNTIASETELVNDFSTESIRTQSVEDFLLEFICARDFTSLLIFSSKTPTFFAFVQQQIQADPSVFNYYWAKAVSDCDLETLRLLIEKANYIPTQKIEVEPTKFLSDSLVPEYLKLSTSVESSSTSSSRSSQAAVSYDTTFRHFADDVSLYLAAVRKALDLGHSLEIVGLLFDSSQLLLESYVAGLLLSEDEIMNLTTLITTQKKSVLRF
jgi:hypothetical protein